MHCCFSVLGQWIHLQNQRKHSEDDDDVKNKRALVGTTEEELGESHPLFM